jgi:hypothetical protein
MRVKQKKKEIEYKHLLLLIVFMLTALSTIPSNSRLRKSQRLSKRPCVLFFFFFGKNDLLQLTDPRVIRPSKDRPPVVYGFLSHFVYKKSSKALIFVQVPVVGMQQTAF